MWRVLSFARPALAVLFLVVVIAGCASAGGQGADSGGVIQPKIGQYVGSTGQGLSFSLWVDEEDGKPIVSAVQYKLEMEASNFTATTELNMPSTRSLEISNGAFSGTDESGSTIEVLSGTFPASNRVVGVLEGSNEHPQGLGTATGETTFEAFWVKP
ncbi:MAG: hypothetical protein WEA61_09380 [Anaerolineales bacterium]